jgi:hypothetical protein
MSSDSNYCFECYDDEVPLILHNSGTYLCYVCADEVYNLNVEYNMNGLYINEVNDSNAYTYVDYESSDDDDDYEHGEDEFGLYIIINSERYYLQPDGEYYQFDNCTECNNRGAIIYRYLEEQVCYNCIHSVQCIICDRRDVNTNFNEDQICTDCQYTNNNHIDMSHFLKYSVCAA